MAGVGSTFTPGEGVGGDFAVGMPIVGGRKLLKKPGPPGLNADKALAAFSREVLNVSRSSRAQYYANQRELLEGKIPSALLGQLQFATQESRAGTAKAEREAASTLASSGATTSTAGQRALGSGELAGELSAGSLPGDMTTRAFQEGASSVLGQASNTLGGFGALAGIGAERYQFARQALGDLYGQGGLALGQLIGAIGQRYAAPAASSAVRTVQTSPRFTG